MSVFILKCDAQIGFCRTPHFHLLSVSSLFVDTPQGALSCCILSCLSIIYHLSILVLCFPQNAALSTVIFF